MTYEEPRAPDRDRRDAPLAEARTPLCVTPHRIPVTPHRTPRPLPAHPTDRAIRVLRSPR
ncbi:hypothetical protein SCNRRL3882_4664 [Streptomyces chartreusis NRRL 3882]|uniref:Uncharacterized protein n=1 Tax=Streptomyces chartreusis NRRL 3882 TaxID=1079985 RepID=A0A2N9BCW1_STRCX|nr:hypothetical protein SCNRRL3882_4664 [Streptomyces chartreusis NRRL 3882]